MIGGIISATATVYWLVYSMLDFFKGWRTSTPFSFKRVWKHWALSLVIFFIGAIIVQIGDNQRKHEFTSEEILFLYSNKPYSKFTKEDKVMASRITNKCTYNPDAEFEHCLPKVMPWKIKEYQLDNSHRVISDSDAANFVEKDLRTKHDYSVSNNY